jgi:hypothetical protein
MNSYTLKQNHTGQYHLFEAKQNLDGKCISENKSMCKKMDYIDSSKFICQDENTTFLECAKLKQQVCGNCMRELYGDHEA